jgi:sulfate/thiosulfate transport system substrate-binding protein
MTPTRPFRSSLTVTLSVIAAAAIGLTACSSSKSSTPSTAGGSAASSGGKDNLVAFSVPKPAYDALQTAFAATAAGKGVSWASSYGASGTQATAVTNGQKADFVTFSVGSDMTKLVPKFVAADWDSGANKGTVSSSVVVIAVRKGNPKGITGWDDLIKPGIKIVTPDPGSSGSAKWNILAAYTHVLEDGGTEAQAQTYLKAFFKNVVSKPSSGSLSTQAFENGTGDVLISYENEAIAARQKSADSLDYIVPKESIQILNPGAVTVNAPQSAKDFLTYIESPAGQAIFASKGFRPVGDGVTVGSVTGANDPANPFPTVAKLETIDELGGWTAVNKKYFDKTDGIVTKIEAGG